MATYTVQTGSDDGFNDSSTWSSAGASYALPAAQAAKGGVRFTGLPVLGNQPALMYRTISLRLTYVAGAAGNLRVYIVEETDPAAFSDSRLPGGLTETLVATEAITVGADTVDIELDAETVHGRYRRPGFSGRVALTLDWDHPSSTIAIVTSESGGGTPALITTGDVPIDSGLAGVPPGPSWADRCPICGGMSLRETWVPSGYLEGVLVCPRCYDPPDTEKWRRPYREEPPTNEEG